MWSNKGIRNQGLAVEDWFFYVDWFIDVGQKLFVRNKQNEMKGNAGKK